MVNLVLKARPLVYNRLTSLFGLEVFHLKIEDEGKEGG